MKRRRLCLLLLGVFFLFSGMAFLALGGRTRPPLPRPAMISVTNGREQIDVLIDGVVVARLAPRKSGVSSTSILFHKSGRTNFAFVISQDDVVIYRPETTCDVCPGDMHSVNFGYGATAPQRWSHMPPRFSAPSLIPGDSSRVWCWLETPSRYMEFFVLKVWGPEDERAVRWRLWRKGYSVRERHAEGNDIRLHVLPPSGWSILEGYMEAKQWKEVSDARFQLVVN